MEGCRRNTCPLQIQKYLRWLCQKRQRQLLCTPCKLAQEVSGGREALESEVDAKLHFKLLCQSPPPQPPKEIYFLILCYLSICSQQLQVATEPEHLKCG